MAADEDQKKTKIAMLGLANAGKTSIIKTLIQEFDLLASVKPTLGVSRESMELLGEDLFFWDFGGQDIYRDRYLSQPDKYFNNITYVFYVVDIQDKFLLDVSVEYFKLALEQLNQYSNVEKFVILFHKADPDLKTVQQAVEIQDAFLSEIRPILKKQNKQPETYQTSIYDPFSIITAFSRTLIPKEELPEKVSEMLADFCENYHIAYSIIFTDQFFEVGNYMVDERMTSILENFFEDIKSYNGSEDVIEVLYEDVQVISSEFTIPHEGMALNFYLVIGFYDEQSIFGKDRLNHVIDKLADNFKKLFMNVDLSKVLDETAFDI